MTDVRTPSPRQPHPLELALSSAQRDAHGLISFDAQGVEQLAGHALNSIFDIATDRTLLDHYNELFFKVGHYWHLSRPPRLHAHDFDSIEGHKFSIEAGVDTAKLLEDCGYRLPPELLDAFRKAEKIRELLFRGLKQSLSYSRWTGMNQSLRVIRYLPGEHEPQGAHSDPPVVAVVVLPRGDNRLRVRDARGRWSSIAAGPYGRAVVLLGEGARRLIPGAVAVEHAVTRSKKEYTRDVATLFIG